MVEDRKVTEMLSLNPQLLSYQNPPAEVYHRRHSYLGNIGSVSRFGGQIVAIVHFPCQSDDTAAAAAKKKRQRRKKVWNVVRAAAVTNGFISHRLPRLFWRSLAA